MMMQPARELALIVFWEPSTHHTHSVWSAWGGANRKNRRLQNSALELSRTPIELARRDEKTSIRIVGGFYKRSSRSLSSFFCSESTKILFEISKGTPYELLFGMPEEYWQSTSNDIAACSRFARNANTSRINWGKRHIHKKKRLRKLGEARLCIAFFCQNSWSWMEKWVEEIWANYFKQRQHHRM